MSLSCDPSTAHALDTEIYWGRWSFAPREPLKLPSLPPDGTLGHLLTADSFLPAQVGRPSGLPTSRKTSVPSHPPRVASANALRGLSTAARGSCSKRPKMKAQ